MSSLPVKLLGETLPITFDFMRQLPLGETIASAVTTVTVLSGTDATPEDMLHGLATISDEIVTQKITVGTPGCIYALSCTATFSGGLVSSTIRKLAVMDSPTGFEVLQITVWGYTTSGVGLTGVYIFADAAFNSEVNGATAVTLVGYWPDEFLYSYPPATDPLAVDPDLYGTYVAVNTPFDYVSATNRWKIDSTSTGNGDMFLALIDVDGVERYAALVVITGGV